MRKNIFKSGYIGIIGRTNVGKSTLINTIFKKNLAITSKKPQTTRNRINCIYNRNDAQAVFVDCPGFFKPKNLLGKKLNNIIYSVLSDVDIIAVMVSAASEIGRGDFYVFEQVRNSGKPKLLILNKIDLLGMNKSEILDNAIKDIGKKYNFFEDVINISALRGTNIEDFLNLVIKKLPEGPRYYPENMITDMPLNKIISEIIRAKLADKLHEELPHSISVKLIDSYSTRTKKGESITRLECIIYVEKKSQKAIVIGKSGHLLKEIGKQARIEIENILNTKVFLQLWVKVMENWTKNELYLNQLGY